jgi:carbon-monoxide dehydrogenase medium subunit
LKPAAFEYHAPRSIEEAVSLLADLEDGRVLAGGQSLVPAMALRLATPAHLIDINEIRELQKLETRDGYLSIGACVRHSAFERAAAPGPLGALLSAVVRHIAHHPIRTRGTFCGSLANADPASEWCLVAATLDARLIVRSTRGTRTIEARDWFQGLMTTSLQPDEILTEVRLPLLAQGERFGFSEFSRRSGDFALAMALVVLGSEPRVGVGGVEPRPRRIPEAEAAAGKGSVEEAAARAVDPMIDQHYSAAYRRDLVRTVVRRALPS